MRPPLAPLVLQLAVLAAAGHGPGGGEPRGHADHTSLAGHYDPLC